MIPSSVEAFVRESNLIEGIRREPTHDEIGYTLAFVDVPRLSILALTDLVGVYQPGAKLRRHPGMDVQVGAYVPPKGGTHVEHRLLTLLDLINKNRIGAFRAYLGYQSLHPFTDGNGRSGRAIWLWQMNHAGSEPSSFLREFHYQTLRVLASPYKGL